MGKAKHVIELQDYGEEEINRLAQAGDAFEKMTEEQRGRAFRWFKSKYPKEWPSNTYQ